MKRIGWLAVGVLCAACAEASDCRLELGSPFADRMVLQRERSVPVWGWGTSDETVTVEFAGQRKTTKIPKSGKWRVDLDPLPACNEGRDLIVSKTFQASRTSQTVLSDVLVVEPHLSALDGEGAVVTHACANIYVSFKNSNEIDNACIKRSLHPLHLNRVEF